MENDSEEASDNKRVVKFWDKQLAHHILALIFIAGQAAVLDYYLVTFNLDKFGHGYGWLAWVVVDAGILIITGFTYYWGRRYINDRLEITLTDGVQSPHGPLQSLGILPYAWIGWLTYSLVLVGKIIAIFKTFGTNLLETDHLGINTLEFTLGAAAAIFMLMVGGLEHYATNAQLHYIRWMQHFVLLEIVDCVEFLTSLFVAAELSGEEVVSEGSGNSTSTGKTIHTEGNKTVLPHALQDVILAFACINLLAPAHALYRLSSLHHRHPETRNRFFLTQTVVGTLFGNIPYFIVRIYLWSQHSYITGLFAMKNLIGICTDSQEVLELYAEYRKAGKKPFEPANVVRERADSKFAVGAPQEGVPLNQRPATARNKHREANGLPYIDDTTET